MKFIIVLVLATFTFGVCAQTAPTGPMTSKTLARNALKSDLTKINTTTGQQYADSCGNVIPNDTGAMQMACQIPAQQQM